MIGTPQLKMNDVVILDSQRELLLGFFHISNVMS